jgi:ABC-2 type transport system permease protein
VAELVVIYRRLVGARIRADWQYRLSFALFTLGQVLVTVLDFGAIIVIFHQVHALAGWSFADVAFLYGSSGVCAGIADTFISPVERASFHIKQGSFDQFLVRPLGPLFQLSTQEFALRRVGKLLQPAVVLIVAATQVSVGWDVARAGVLFSSLAAGVVIFGAIWVMTSSLAFWTVDTQEVANSFTYGGSLMTQYPLDVLGVWMRRFVLFVPLAFVNYLPATWLLHRPDVLGLPVWVRLSSPVVALLVALVARAVWLSAIRHYRSTGS